MRTLHFDAHSVAKALDYPRLIPALAQGLREEIAAPARSHYEPNRDGSCVLVMPAWRVGEAMGIKLVSVWPNNHQLGLPAVSGVYILFDAHTGRPVAVMDGTELTLRRTAAAAALAAHRLARSDSRHLLVVGTGALSPHLAMAHAAVLDLHEITVFGRRPAMAKSVAEQLCAQGLPARATENLELALDLADIVAVATTASKAFIPTRAVGQGTHLGLIGAFTRQMAEAEPSLMAQAKVFADQRTAVLDKGGEVYQAIEQGLMPAEGIIADLAEMVARPQKMWRHSDQEITVYKSVGFASLDLIAAELVMRAQDENPLHAQVAQS